MECWSTGRSLVLWLLLIAISNHQADCLRILVVQEDQRYNASVTTVVTRIYVTDSNPDTNNSNWREALADENRQQILRRMEEALQRTLPDAGQDQRLQTAQRCEAEVFQAATDREDYLRKIALKLLDFEIQPDQGSQSAHNPQDIAYPERARVSGQFADEIQRRMKREALEEASIRGSQVLASSNGLALDPRLSLKS